MATKKKEPEFRYVDTEFEYQDEFGRDGVVYRKPHPGGKYAYIGDEPGVAGGRGNINPPMARKAITGKLVVGKPEDLTPAERRKFSRTPPDEGPTENKAKGGKVGSASKRADGCCQRGKTRGKMV